MAEKYKHARAISPYFIPNTGGSPDDFHGVTDIGGDPSVATEDVFVISQSDKCGTERDIAEVTVPVTQLERGEIETYLTLANLTAEPAGGIRLTNFSSGLVDVIQYFREEESGDIEGVFWFPKTAINSLSLSVDADERLVRTFDLIGENRRVGTGANRHIIYVTNTAPSGTSGSYVITLNDPVPSVDPDIAGKYIQRVDRTRAGVTETLTEVVDYAWNNGLSELDILAAVSDDKYDIYFSADSFGSAGDPTTPDADPQCFLKAEYVTVLISDSVTEVELDNITSISFDASLTRLNEATVGTTDKIKEITETPVTLSTTGRVTKDFKVEKAFMNSLASADMLSDVNTFRENVRVTIKIYDSAAKDTFLIGYQLDNLSFNDSSLSVTANEFASLDFGASTTDVLITKVEGNLT